MYPHWQSIIKPLLIAGCHVPGRDRRRGRQEHPQPARLLQGAGRDAAGDRTGAQVRRGLLDEGSRGQVRRPSGIEPRCPPHGRPLRYHPDRRRSQLVHGLPRAQAGRTAERRAFPTLPARHPARHRLAVREAGPLLRPGTDPGSLSAPLRRKGMRPGSASLLERGGLNSQLCNALRENTPRNGVLTAVEDYLRETEQALRSSSSRAMPGWGSSARPARGAEWGPRRVPQGLGLPPGRAGVLRAARPDPQRLAGPSHGAGSGGGTARGRSKGVGDGAGGRGRRRPRSGSRGCRPGRRGAGLRMPRRPRPPGATPARIGRAGGGGPRSPS